MRKWRMSAIAAVLVAVALLATASPRPAAAATSGTLRIDPPSQTVPAGSPFTVNIVQTVDGESLGAQATLSYDPGAVQIVSVETGPMYAGATLLVGKTPGGATGQDEGTPLTPDEAITEANTTGVLKYMATFFVPGTGTFPAGENVFLAITLQGVADGSTPLNISDLEMLDDQGGSLPVTGANGNVVIEGSAPPPPPPSDAGAAPAAPAATAADPGAALSAAATALAGKSKTPVSSVAAKVTAPSLTSATLSISPKSQNVDKEGKFSFTISADVDGAASNAQLGLTFKRGLVDVTKLEPGPNWQANASSLDSAMTAANDSGELKVTLAASKDTPQTSGEAPMLTVTMQGLPGKEGKTDLALSSIDVIGTDGQAVPVTSVKGDVTVGSGGGGGSMMFILIGALAGVAIVGGGGTYAFRRYRAARS